VSAKTVLQKKNYYVSSRSVPAESTTLFSFEKKKAFWKKENKLFNKRDRKSILFSSTDRCKSKDLHPSDCESSLSQRKEKIIIKGKRV